MRCPKSRGLSGTLLALSVTTGGCDSPGNRGVVIHPILDSLATPPGEAIVLSRTRGPTSDASVRKIRAFREPFERREVVGRIGDLDGGDETTFALLWDAAVTDAGEVLILDRIQAVVRVFTATGDYLYTLGGQGEGPGELRVPEAVLISPGGDLVADGQRLWQARIEEFWPTEIREETSGKRTVRRGIFDNDALHVLERIAGGDGVPVLVQHRFYLSEDLQNGTGRYKIETYALDPETGEGEFWGDSLPSILAVTDEYVVFSWDTPFPRVEVAQIRK